MEETAKSLPAFGATFIPPLVPFEPQAIVGKPHLRFTEDILIPKPIKPEAKSRKRKKKPTQGKERDEDSSRLRKLRREPEISIDEDEEY